jgi:hypothetical protein
MIETQKSQFYIGWDVGGWNCDRNANSRDALVILDADRKLVGIPWRGNLRIVINDATDTTDWLTCLFALCDVDYPSGSAAVTLAIDTPLGFSQPFINLITQGQMSSGIHSSETNPYLYRQTEQWLFDRGLKPLSAIKDMIGSQATKGLHVLARFAPTIQSCGVWVDDLQLTVIEAYPSACKTSPIIEDMIQPFVHSVRLEPYERCLIPVLDHTDKVDALTCALTGWLYAHKHEELGQPDESIPLSEGWIWVPKDGLLKDYVRTIRMDL